MLNMAVLQLSVLEAEVLELKLIINFIFSASSSFLVFFWI